jgi:hypothetical protein
MAPQVIQSLTLSCAASDLLTPVGPVTSQEMNQLIKGGSR